VFSLVRSLAAVLPIASLMAAIPLGPVQARALFSAMEVDQTKFVIVAAPIGDGERAQLNIYEQRSEARPCFAVLQENPSKVDPLLATFDFTGICNRFIDGNGYSLRLGEKDLGSVYRISVIRERGDNLLVAFPSEPGVGPEMVLARSGGHTQNSDYLLLKPEPGWKLMRRAFGGRSLGHVYLYREVWPATAGVPKPQEEAAPPPVPGLW